MRALRTSGGNWQGAKTHTPQPLPRSDPRQLAHRAEVEVRQNFCRDTPHVLDRGWVKDTHPIEPTHPRNRCHNGSRVPRNVVRIARNEVRIARCGYPGVQRTARHPSCTSQQRAMSNAGAILPKSLSLTGLALLAPIQCRTIFTLFARRQD